MRTRSSVGLTTDTVDMDEAFVVMQIGDAEMDVVHDQAIAPAIAEAGLAARRVDRHNEGDLLKSEIVEFIERSQIIVADLTNERPNCYLEVGYAMGLGKKANLILTVRADHHWSHAGFKRDGPRVHFDLEGYDLLFWEPDALDAFRDELAKRIRRRLAVVSPSSTTAVQIGGEPNWRDPLRERGLTGLTGVGRKGYLEITAELVPLTAASQQQLLTAMRESVVHTFGWPIGVVLDARDEYRPRPTMDGVEAEVSIGEGESSMGRVSYDYWKVFRDGRFYTLMSLFEDDRLENGLFWDTRTVRTAEAVLLLARLYRRLGASDTDRVSVTFRHGGLSGRKLHVANSNRIMVHHPESSEETVETRIESTVSGLETEITSLVRSVVDPLLTMFGFYTVSPEILDGLIEGYVAGEVG